MIKSTVALFLLCITLCQAEIIGEKSFSVPEVWFEHFQVPIPRGMNQKNISTSIQCNQITPLVRYQLILSYSKKDGISAAAKMIQDPSISIQYLQSKSASEPAVPFLTAKNIKGSIQLSGNFTQLGGNENGKILYHVVLTAFERVSCDLGQFFRYVPNCLTGVYEVDLQSGKISSVQTPPHSL